MFFKLTKSTIEPLTFLRAKLNYFAPIRIKNYPFGASELILDAYLRQQYKKSLKALCLEIFKNSVCHKTPENELLLLLPREYDNIAQLITYGNGPISGSPILKKAFKLE